MLVTQTFHGYYVYCIHIPTSTISTSHLHQLQCQQCARDFDLALSHGRHRLSHAQINSKFKHVWSNMSKKYIICIPYIIFTLHNTAQWIHKALCDFKHNSWQLHSCANWPFRIWDLEASWSGSIQGQSAKLRYAFRISGSKSSPVHMSHEPNGKSWKASSRSVKISLFFPKSVSQQKDAFWENKPNKCNKINKKNMPSNLRKKTHLGFMHFDRSRSIHRSNFGGGLQYSRVPRGVSKNRGVSPEMDDLY